MFEAGNFAHFLHLLMYGNCPPHLNYANTLPCENYNNTRNILDCDQSNYSSRIILAHIPAKLLSWSWIILRIPEIGLYSFEIFQDDVRPPLVYGSTGSRSIQYANPENYISTKHVDRALFAIRKLSQLKAAILFPASKLYSLRYTLPYKI